jgi:dipeptidyl-peptidase-4
MRKTLLFSLLLMTGSLLLAQLKNGEDITLEDALGRSIVRMKSFGTIEWLDDGKSYIKYEFNKDNQGTDIIQYDAISGNRTVLVSALKFIPEGQDKSLQLAGINWSQDHKKLLIFTNTKRVWRYNTKGDYWVLDLLTGKLQQLGKNLEPSSMMFTKFSPDGNRVAYVSKLNVYVENLSSGIVTQITKDGGDNIINGTFDWVYEEEFDCRDGFRWSSDGKYIAYWQSDTKGTGVFYIIDNVDSIYPKLIPIPYPKAGTTNSAVKVGIVSSNGGETKWFPIPGDTRNNYIPRMDFIPNSNELIVQQLNRLQNTNTVWICDAATMGIHQVLVDQDKAWVDLFDKIYWIKNQKYFTWISERDGWRHMYLVSRDGKEMNLITKGDFDMSQVERGMEKYAIAGFDEQSGYVYYIASPDNFTQRYLYRSRLDGKGKAERISQAGMDGQHSYNIAPGAKLAIHTFQNHLTPPVTSLVSLPDHKTIKVYEDNKEGKAAFEALHFRPKEFFRVDIGDIILDGWMLKPIKFDSTRKYPVIFHIYGEPASSTVQDSWNTDAYNQYLAQQGYIIMSIDNRGASVARGREWRKCIYGEVGTLASHDQSEATKKIIERYHFVDPDRIGIWGWSGGGSQTLNCMFRYPDVYKTGIAVASVPDERLYDDVYQERYMGLPQENAEGYRKGSPITYAGNLKGNLLVIHGTGDDNVHYQGCEMLINELVKNNKMFSLMSYPMRSHGIYEGINTSKHLYYTMDKFWKTNLPQGPK